MAPSGIAAAFVVVLIFIIVVRARAPRRPRRRHGNTGPAAIGAVYDLLNEDKRKAVEIIVEGHAERRDPEFPDANMPDLDALRRAVDKSRAEAAREGTGNPER